MFEKFKKRAVENVKGTLKDETIKCVDELLPTIIGVASLAFYILVNIQSPKPVSTSITINNYYLR